MAKKTFTINKVQGGWWGQMVIRTFQIEADDERDAFVKAKSRKDHLKRLANGDLIRYELAAD